jgi:hypothetical protein
MLEYSQTKLMSSVLFYFQLTTVVFTILLFFLLFSFVFLRLLLASCCCSLEIHYLLALDMIITENMLREILTNGLKAQCSQVAI